MPSYARTFIKVRAEFVAISDFSGALPDTNYIEGAIELSVDGDRILTLKHWDLVDQLWAYLVEGLTSVNRGSEYKACFPDQPLELQFRPLLTSRLEVTVGDDSYVVDRKAFFETVVNGALDFFDEMDRINPQASDTWHRYSDQARHALASQSKSDTGA